MQLSNAGGIVTIEGNIKSISDFQNIKNLLDTISVDNTSINLKITNSISITSSIIGYLTKLVYKDKIRLSMEVGNQSLYDLLDELSLISEFNVKKIK